MISRKISEENKKENICGITARTHSTPRKNNKRNQSGEEKKVEESEPRQSE